MNKKNISIICLLTYFSYHSAQADTKCISGNPESTNIVDQLTNAKKNNKLTQIIYNKYNLNQKTEATTSTDPTCLTGDCPNSLLTSPIQSIRSTTLQAPEPPKMAFNHDCLRASNTFVASAPQISCPKNSANTKTNMCITDEQLKYQNAVISSFANCAIKEGFAGVDLNAIFQKYSIESTFKPQYASGDGLGIGQLTSIFVEDIHQKHRGFKFMNKIATSTSSDCDAARQIAEADVKNKPRFSNKCSFISVGEGLERNILYSIIGVNTVWEMNIEPKLRGYLKKYATDPNIDEVRKLVLMNAYGRGGPAASTAAIRRLSALSPTQFIKRMKQPLYTENHRNLTEYTSNIDKRQKKIATKLPESIKAEFAKTGAEACLNH
ncbi:MAG: hypothetical protein WA160_04570 [Pseudobdellovibrio sp.]